MIINESRKDPVEFEIVNPKKFISAMGGLVDNSINEDKAFDAMLRQMLANNKMSAPPTPTEVKKSNNKIKIPWALVGVAMHRLQDWGINKKK